MLRTGGIEKGATNGPGPGVGLGESHQVFECARQDFGIVVQKEEIASPGLGDHLVVRLRETQVFRVSDPLHRGERSLDRFQAFVEGGVVDHPSFDRELGFGQALGDGLEASDQVFFLVEGNDDDREVEIRHAS